MRAAEAALRVAKAQKYNSYPLAMIVKYTPKQYAQWIWLHDGHDPSITRLIRAEVH